MNKRLLVFLAVLVFLISCAATKQYERWTGWPDLELVGSYVFVYVGSDDVYRFVDEDARAACWIVKQSNSSIALSCLPLSELELDL